MRIFFARTEHYLLRGDDLWFFFASHGRRRDDRIDYLLLSDSDVENIEGSSFSVNYVIQRLQLIGADKILIIYRCLSR